MTSTEYKKCEDRAFYLLLGCIALGVFAFITEMVFIQSEWAPLLVSSKGSRWVGLAHCFQQPIQASLCFG